MSRSSSKSSMRAGTETRRPRIYVEADLAAGTIVQLETGQLNYLKNVMRLGPGDEALVFNGRDGEWCGAIVDLARKSGSLECIEQTRTQTASPHLRYLFAPLKHARLDYMVQKATEMGAGVLEPVLTRHTMVSRVNTGRMRANAIEAAEQCTMLSVPQVNEPLALEAVLRDWPVSSKLIYCDEAAEMASPLDVLSGMDGVAAGVLIGPEGGFSQAERQMLASLDFVVAISLGPRIMRADTAAVAALAVVQATLGDWR